MSGLHSVPSRSPDNRVPAVRTGGPENSPPSEQDKKALNTEMSLQPHPQVVSMELPYQVRPHEQKLGGTPQNRSLQKGSQLCFVLSV